MLDPLTAAEIQALRLNAKSWQILLNNLKRPYVGRRARGSKRLLSIFLQGFAVSVISRLEERGDPRRSNEEAPTAKPSACVRIIRSSRLQEGSASSHATIAFVACRAERHRVVAISSTAPTRTTPSSRSAARTRNAVHIRSEAHQNICRNPAHHSANHRYAARFATSCAISCFAASEPARDRVRLLLYR